MKSKKILAKIVFVLLSLYLLYVVGERLHQSYGVNQKVEALAEEIEALKSENEDMLRKIAYYKSNDYKEKIARERLGMQKAGEQVIVILPQTKVEVVEEVPSVNYSNPEKWYRFFFISS